MRVNLIIQGFNKVIFVEDWQIEGVPHLEDRILYDDVRAVITSLYYSKEDTLTEIGAEEESFFEQTRCIIKQEKFLD